MKNNSSPQNSSLRRALAVTGAIALLAMVSPSAHAQVIVANFTGGNDTTNGGAATPGPDTFFGTAGNGWGGPWQIAGNTPGQLTGTVTNTSPLAGGGNYLMTTDSATDTNDSTLTRNYTSLSSTSLQTISFNYELDSSLANFNTSNNYVTVGDAVPGAAGVSSASSFIIRAYGASPATGVNALTWVLYNGGANGLSFNPALFTNSTIALVSGDVYKFTINLNPSTLSYNATIADTTAGTTYTSGTLGFRTNQPLQDTIAFNDKNGTGSALQYSVDNVLIVPEPTSMAYVVCGFLALMGITIQRSRQGRA